MQQHGHMNGRRRRRSAPLGRVLVLAGALLWGACGDKGSNPVGPTGPNVAPAITSATLTPSTVPHGGTATLRVEARDPEGDAINVAAQAQHGRVVFDTGTSASSASAAAWIATYTHDGTSETDSIRITATDSKNAVAQMVKEVTIEPPPSEPPLARFSGPTEGEVGQALTFDGSRSRDPDGTIARHDWDFGDGATALGAVVTHAFAQTGTFTVTLSVTDNDGIVARRSQDVTIINPPAKPPAPPPNHAPVASLTGGSCHPKKSAFCTVSLTANAQDPDGDTLTYSWGGCASGSSSSSSCKVTSPGSYSASVSVSDGRGGTASASATVTGTNNAPQLDHVEGTLQAGVTRTINFWFDDPDDDNYIAGSCEAYLSSGNCVLNSFSCVGVYTGAMRIEASITANASARGQTCGFIVSATDDWGAKGVPPPVSVAVE